MESSESETNLWGELLNKPERSNKNLKTCKICEVDKPIEEYYERKIGSGRYFVFCKDCFRERQRRYHENNIEKERERLRKYYHDKKKNVEDFIDGKDQIN